jgi:hypothetical protein
MEMALVIGKPNNLLRTAEAVKSSYIILLHAELSSGIGQTLDMLVPYTIYQPSLITPFRPATLRSALLL